MSSLREQALQSNAETYDYGPQTRDQAGRRRTERPPGAKGARGYEEQNGVKGAAELDVQEQPPSDARGSGGRRLREWILRRRDPRPRETHDHFPA